MAIYEETSIHRAAPAGLSGRNSAWNAPAFGGFLAAAAWFGAAYVAQHWDDVGEWTRTREFTLGAAAFAAAILLLSVASVKSRPLAARIRRASPWLIFLGVFFTAWEYYTAKTTILPQPFFPPPQAILEVYTDDYEKLGISVLHSLRLNLIGYVIGASVGFTLGVAMGWSRIVGYWAHPILRFIGPLPATAWLPIAFFAFPSSWSASIFLVALATGFPVAVLTWSGVANTPSAYYDVARTLGANQRFLVLKVAIPAAMPHVFVGLFMGLASSFAVLVVAEMLGVKAGLGWYLQWAQGWAAYNNMYGALVVMSLMCTGLITLLFRIRDHFLSWQKGLVKW